MSQLRLRYAWKPSTTDCSDLLPVNTNSSLAPSFPFEAMISPGRQIEKWQSASRFLVQKPGGFFKTDHVIMMHIFSGAQKRAISNMSTDVLGHKN